MVQNRKILFIYTDSRTFVEQDFRILSSEYDVTRYRFVNSKNPFFFALEFVKQFFGLLFWGWKYDIFYIWFADYHSLLPAFFAKWTGKKCVIVIGGYDVCRIPKIRYGAFFSKFRGFFTIRSIRNCTLNLSVSNYVDRKIKYIAPKAPRHLIYNCIEFNSEKNDDIQKEKLFITVANIHNVQTFYRKGIDVFIEVARLLPGFNFIIIGINKEALSALLTDLPSNISLIEQTNHDDLVVFYQKAEIYCQFSRMDTFCLALAEAMYFNCIPVITNVGGMPEVINENGFKVPFDTQRIAKTLKSVLDSPPEKNFREFIISKFHFNNRKEAILKTLKSLQEK